MTTATAVILLLLITIKLSLSRPSALFSTKHGDVRTRNRRSEDKTCQVHHHTGWNIYRRPVVIPYVKCDLPCVKEYFDYDTEELKNGVWVKATIKVPVSCRLPKKCPKTLTADFNNDRIPNIIFKTKCEHPGREITNTYPMKYKKSDGTYKVVLEEVPIGCACPEECAL